MLENEKAREAERINIAYTDAEPNADATIQLISAKEENVVAVNEPITISDGDSEEMSPFRLSFPILPMHPRDPLVPNNSIINPSEVEFRKLKDTLTDLSGEGSLRRHHIGLSGEELGSDLGDEARPGNH
ncbi:unnamed protein product [Ilex paraguariensis]|uniref:Uncharacterized protein n=2 Tax=Ilex paraguariensis TaxID=185542 RepID=A0ABC8TGI5_9AQUA